MRLYIASRFKNREIIREQFLPALIAAGVTPVCSWIDEHPDCTPVQAAARDLGEIQSCDALLLCTENCEAVPGGMHVEFGYAMATNKYLFVCGPKVNVFLHLSNYHADDLQGILPLIQQIAERDRLLERSIA